MEDLKHATHMYGGLSVSSRTGFGLQLSGQIEDFMISTSVLYISIWCFKNIPWTRGGIENKISIQLL